MKEKLIDLLSTAGWNLFADGLESKKQIADHLVRNGVTIPEWIPVTERLPEKDVLVLCVGAKGGVFIGSPRFVYGEEDTAYTYVPNSRRGRNTKYWMPLPELPEK